MKILIVVIVIAIIWCIVFANRKKLEKFVDNNFEYELTFGSINKMEYDELDKIHNDLLPLCNEILFSSFECEDDNLTLSNQKRENKVNEKLPKEKQIYGCKTYGDAENLNHAIVKKLDEIDKMRGEDS